MNHEIDLSKYQIRTDLAIETLEQYSDIKCKIDKETYGDIRVTKVLLDSISAKKIDKKEGVYITIEFDDITDYNNLNKVKKVFINKLKELLKLINIKDNDKCLVIGLGNNNSTPDSLGPITINNILVTSHLFMLGNVEEGFRNISAFTPGVMAETGIETSDMILGIVEKIKPDFIIVVDALASTSIERVNKTIQITDTGIHPGSGIGNSRKEISKEILNVPVIALGVPTTVDAVTIVSDTINYMFKHFSYTKENINNPSNKLKIGEINYLKRSIKENKDDKKKLLGMIGSLNDHELRQLIFEVLTPIGYNLMVTPKEIDFVISKLGDLIGNGINRALNKKIDSI